jgi:hypothetical protein
MPQPANPASASDPSRPDGNGTNTADLLPRRAPRRPRRPIFLLAILAIGLGLLTTIVSAFAFAAFAGDSGVPRIVTLQSPQIAGAPAARGTFKVFSAATGRTTHRIVIRLDDGATTKDAASLLDGARLPWTLPAELVSLLKNSIPLMPGDVGDWTFEADGSPFAALVSGVVDFRDGQGSRTIGGFESSLVDLGVPRSLAVRPLWLGALANAAIFATLWLAALVFVRSVFERTRASGRSRRGLCPICAYDLTAAAKKSCPECGWNADNRARE